LANGGSGVDATGDSFGVHASFSLTGGYGGAHGVGLHGVSTVSRQTGVGLRVDGRSIFRTARSATVSGSKNDVVLAPVQKAGSFYVVYAKAAAGSFAIQINKAPAFQRPSRWGTSLSAQLRVSESR
jgi:hypothetical protein